jgi:hypothetical protein
MKLPDLPKQNKKKEADFGITFRRWIEKNPRFSCSLEMKQTTTDSIPFSAIEEEQLIFGMAIRSEKGVLVRIKGTIGEPDYIWCRNMPSYIVVRYPKFFCLIPVPIFIQEKQRSKRKSLVGSRAKELSTCTVAL